VAVVHEGEQLTYAELDARANQLAHHLRRHGVGPETRVALCFERSMALVVAILGVLKAGGAYVPLDPAYPEERLRFMLADSGAGVLVTRRAEHQALGAVPDAAGPDVVYLDTDARQIATQPTTPCNAAALPGQLCYVIYTSGSTGTPKGVQVEHRQLRAYLAASRARLTEAGKHDAGASDGAALRYALVQPVTFDSSMLMVWQALTTGGSLHVIPRDMSAIGTEVGTYFRQHAIDAVKITPSHLAALQASGLTADMLPRRWVVLGGESAPHGWARELAAQMLPGGTLFNHYGPTETTVGVLMHPVDGDDPNPSAEVLTLGRPNANVRVYVLDAYGAAVPVGVAGELHIGGAQVARGYLNRPGLTAERFVPDPFSTVPGARLYRTGDLTHWAPNGTVAFLGRTDFQVKLRGYRIELGEVEAALSAHPFLQTVAVIVREDVPGSPRLVAYYVPLPAADAVGTEALREFLGEHLPVHMVPTAYVGLERLPLTPSGKLDRRALQALPAPDGSQFGARGYEAPVGAEEEAVAAIWAELLGVERVGRHDDFFALGGHSLLAVRLVERMRRQDLHADIRTLFTNPTVAAMAAAGEDDDIHEIRL
jgi:amino acid adenylation domain-containing protein